jgi:hypothetical protein
MALEFDNSVRLVVTALQELDGERAIDVLPALQTLFLDTHHWQLPGPIREASEQFVAKRQLYGHPVTIHY